MREARLDGNVDKQVRKASFDMQALLACARGELFGPGNAKLPLPPMLMFDRITQICDVGGMFGKGEIHADLEIKPRQKLRSRRRLGDDRLGAHRDRCGGHQRGGGR